MKVTRKLQGYPLGDARGPGFRTLVGYYYGGSDGEVSSKLEGSALGETLGA